jgi:mannose-6-phosphate isomerase-like protein (cupin superfamily)
MRLKDATVALFGATLALSSQAISGTYSSSQFSKVIATETVPNQEPLQLYFSVRAGTFWSEEIEEVAPGDGIYYQYFGSVEILLGDARKVLYAGDGLYMPMGTRFRLKPIGISPQRTYLQFLVLPMAEPDPVAQTSGASVEVYRSPSPVPGLARDRNVLSLTRVPVPPLSGYDPPHQRTGAALHYVVSGVGAELIDGKAAVRSPDSVSYEPAEVFYQWSNPNSRPLTYLVFNVNPKNRPQVVEVEERPTDPLPNDSHITWAIFYISLSMLLTLIVNVTSMDKRRGKQVDPDSDERGKN